MIRAPLPSSSTGLGPRVALALVGLSLAVLLLAAAPVHGEGGTTVTGHVVNGTSGADAPADLEVTLHIFGTEGEVDTARGITDGDGRFRFEDVEARDDSIYAVTASYHEVLYSSGLDFRSLEEPVELLVYESTSSIEEIVVDADVLLLRGVDGEEMSLAAFEVVSLVNVGDRTFVPDLSRPAMMNFMRFSLPPGATGLDVRSDLPGGDVVSVGTGFALTAPVTPGSHEVIYSFRVPYQGSRLEYDRSFPMGAGTFRLLVEQGLGDVHVSSLESMPPADFEGRSHRVWEATGLTPGTRIGIEMTELPGPDLLSRLGDALNDGPYLKVGIPAVVGAVLLAILVYALFSRGAEVPPFRGRGAPGEMALVSGASSSKWDRRSLVEGIARLDDLYQSGEMVQGEYERRRDGLKTRLLQIAPEP